MVEIDSKNPELDRYTIRAVVKHLENNDEPITYGDLAEAVGEMRGETMAADGFAHALGRIQGYCKELGLPILPAMVVNKESWLPGPGFMEAYEDVFPGASAVREEVIVKGEQVCCAEREDWQPLLNL